MAKKSKSSTLSKKHMARQEREQVQTRLILLTTLFVVIIVVGLIGYGLLNEFVIQPSRPVIKVGDDKVSVTDFKNFYLFNGQQTINNYLQNTQLAQMFGYDATYVSSLRDQATASLNKDALGNQTLTYLIEDILIRQEADRRGISVTEEEINKSLEEQFNFFPDGTPTPKPTFSTVATSTLSATQKALFPPTSTPTVTAVITSTAALTETLPTATVVLENTPTSTLSVTNTPQPTEIPAQTPTETLTPTPYTQDLFEENFQRVIDDFGKNGISEKTIHFLIESQLYRQKVQEAVLAEMNLTPEEEKVWARHILVPDEATAKLVLDLLKNGAIFAEIAPVYSTDTGSAQNGGDLGWFGKGKMVAEFEKAAFSLGVGEISEPVQTSFGYHIIQVLGHEVQPLTESDFNTLKNQKFQEWLDTQREATEVVISDIWRDAVPDLNLPEGA